MKKMLRREGDMNVNAGYVIQTNSTNDKNNNILLRN